MKTLLKFLILSAVLLPCLPAKAIPVVLIDNDTLAYYNGSIGTVLNDTSAAFPVDGDPDLDFTNAPDLSAANSLLGNWLAATPVRPPQYWTPIPVPVPSQWPVDSESAIMYRLEVPTNGYSNLNLSFGIDNGIFVWFDGRYLGGYLRPGGATLGEHQFALTNIASGTHYIQVLREDHGSANDYIVEVTTDVAPVPVPIDIHTAVEISWQSGGNSLYQVQRATTLDPTADWTDFGKPVAGDGSELSVFDRTRDLQYKYYQVLRLK